VRDSGIDFSRSAISGSNALRSTNPAAGTSPKIVTQANGHRRYPDATAVTATAAADRLPKPAEEVLGPACRTARAEHRQRPSGRRPCQLPEELPGRAERDLTSRLVARHGDLWQPRLGACLGEQAALADAGLAHDDCGHRSRAADRRGAQLGQHLQLRGASNERGSSARDLRRHGSVELRPGRGADAVHLAVDEQAAAVEVAVGGRSRFI
jgi:hypothetical protein